LATSEKGYTAANGTQVPERTEWHNIVLWRGLANIAEKYIRKGSKIYVEGKIRSRSYDDQQGNKRYVTEVWGDNLELLDRKPDGGFPATPEPVLAATPETPANAPTPIPSAQSAANPPLPSGENEDLPF
jgi:single-strand DNA-binding protein